MAASRSCSPYSVLYTPLKSQEGTAHIPLSLQTVVHSFLCPKRGGREWKGRKGGSCIQLWWGCGALWHPGGVFLLNCCCSPAVITNKKLKSILPPALCSRPHCSQVSPQRSPMEGTAETQGPFLTPKEEMRPGSGNGPQPSTSATTKP